MSWLQNGQAQAVRTVIRIHLDFENGSGYQAPSAETFHAWLVASLSGLYPDAELALKIVDEVEMTTLNGRYRNQAKPTNVLSFPADLATGKPPNLNTEILGDIALCAPVIEQESAEQGKELQAHYAHMSVHGALHLAGLNHQNEVDASRMEALEIRILNTLGFPNPYEN